MASYDLASNICQALVFGDERTAGIDNDARE
jgi:hypothetical protein